MAAISGNEPQLENSWPIHLPPYPSGETFGKLLSWHLRINGTRPDNRPGQRGRIWRPTDFAEAVDSDERTIRNWRGDKNPPHNIEKICTALFGDSTFYDGWRDDLCLAALAMQKKDNYEQKYASSKIKFGRFINLPPRTSGFISRKRELAWLAKNLVIDRFSKSRCTAIVSMFGGVGKTALTVEFAYKNAEHFSHIIWCPAGSREDILNTLAGLASLFEVNYQNEPDKLSVVRLVLQKISASPSRSLIIFDNLQSPKIAFDLMPESAASVLITTQFPYWSDIGPVLCLSVLKLSDSVRLLNLLAGQKDKRGAEILAITLGCLPLALNHAAITCRRCKITFEEYARDAEEYIISAPQLLDNERCVFATFEMMINKLSLSNSALSLLSFISFCGPEQIPEEMIEDCCASKAELNKSLLNLVEMSLITIQSRRKNGRRIFVHRLIQSVVRLKAQEANKNDIYLGHICAKLGELIPHYLNCDNTSYELSNLFVQHAIVIHQRHADFLLSLSFFPKFLGSASTYLMFFGLHDLADKLLGTLQRICESKLASIENFYVLEGDWLKFMNEKFYLKFKNCSDFIANRLITDECHVTIQLRARNQLLWFQTGCFKRPFEEILKLFDVSLSLILLSNGPKSFKACEELCVSGIHLKKFGYNGDFSFSMIHTFRFMAAEFSYPLTSNLDDFIERNFSWDVLTVMVPDDNKLIDIARSRINFLNKTDAGAYAEIAQITGNLASVEERLRGSSAGFILYKQAYRLLMNNLGHNDPDTLDALVQVALALIRAGKVRFGNDLFQKSTNLLLQVLGPDSYYFRSAIKKHAIISNIAKLNLNQ